MNYVVLSCALKNFKSIGMRTNSFHDFVRSKPLVCQGLIIPTLHLKVSSINQDPIVNIEVSCFLNMKGASFMVDSFKDIMDVVVHYSHLVKAFFCGKGGEFVVVVEVYGARIKAIETFIGVEFVHSSGCSIVSKCSER